TTAPAVEPAVEETASAETQTQPGPALAAPQADKPGNPVGVEAAMASAPAAAPTDDSGWLEKYRLQLKVAAKKYELYPKVARDHNWEGLVALRMAFSANGRLASLSVIKTSGHDVLDRQAIEMFKSAAAAV